MKSVGIAPRLLIATTFQVMQNGGVRAADLGPLIGVWWGVHTACGKPTDDIWSIDRDGASAFESTCRVKTVSRSRAAYVLKQRCEGFENEKWNSSVKIRIIGPSELEIEGKRYRRCRSPN